MAPPHKLHSRCGKMGRGLSSTDCLADRGDRQKDRATCRFTFCALALGQRLHDSDATLKAFLSRRQADALQSKQRLGDISQGTAAGLRQHANSLFLKGCLFSVHVTNGGSIDGSSAPQQCTCVHTHTHTPRFLSGHYFTILILHTGRLLCFTLICTCEGVERWMCARF